MSEPNLTAESELSNVSYANSSRPTKSRWTEDETQALVEGCNKHGVGSWTQILSDAELLPRFSDRTPGDLKDRFRTYFPDSYHELYPNAKTHWGNQSRGKAPDGRSIFEKGKVKERRPFTEEEDRALMRGYKTYGSHWALIARDPAFKNQRRSTDVRDRFRNAFPDEYARAGYKPRSKAKSKSAKTKAAIQAREKFSPNTSSPVAESEQMLHQMVGQGINTSNDLPMTLSNPSAPSNSADSVNSSPVFDRSMQMINGNNNYPLMHSQALLSPEMIHAVAQGIPMHRSNMFQFYDPIHPGPSESESLASSVDAQRGVSAQNSTQPIQRSQSTHGTARPTYQRTRSMIHNKEAVDNLLASTYFGDHSSGQLRTWDALFSGATVTGERQTQQFSLLPTHSSNPANEQYTLSVTNGSSGTNNLEQFNLQGVVHNNPDPTSSLFAAAGIPAPPGLMSSTLSSFAPMAPSELPAIDNSTAQDLAHKLTHNEQPGFNQSSNGHLSSHRPSMQNGGPADSSGPDSGILSAQLNHQNLFQSSLQPTFQTHQTD
ncbi:hypothetical protein MYAM1_000660 [Malassezia yamatoensis]|uniref:Uncharacterized protein n=1 Tax=Malassezia yamatoensis TaxID=253288 RepID=A0AAJ5YRL2_9BASI|nr:hypothetical protein MYAM1_000660 [Malassezia yamatoensis]